MKYNLTRYNSNDSFINDSARNLLRLLTNRQDKTHFVELFQGYISETNVQESKNSKVMEALVKIINKQVDNSGSKMVNEEKINSIIESLLSSPCNFTPLLHFVIPVEYMDMRAFAEIWINTEEENSQNSGEIKKNTHMLIVFDIESIGQFELEFIFIIAPPNIQSKE